jgi:endonuclease/exonuclease/phosphatase family metal-dependent hydrolase
MAPRPYTFRCPGQDDLRAGTINWVSPAQPGDSAALAVWCETVGPPVIDSVPAATANSPEDTILVATWNLAGGGGDLSAFLAGELSWTCQQQRSAPGPGFRHFVLLVQEAFRRSPSVPPFPEGETVPLAIEEEQRPGPRRDIAAWARHCGLAVFYAPSMRNGATEYADGREDKGNAILATVPLHDFIAIELPFETQRRVAVGATVQPPGGDSLRVVNLHLDVSPGLWRILKTGNSSRLRQALGVVDALNAIEASRSGVPRVVGETCEHACTDPGGDHPISTVLAGDLNTWSGDQSVIKHLAEWFPESPSEDGLPTRGEFPADHMFFRQRATWPMGPQLVPESYRRVDRQYHSDHLARLFLVRLR